MRSARCERGVVEIEEVEDGRVDKAKFRSVSCRILNWNRFSAGSVAYGITVPHRNGDAAGMAVLSSHWLGEYQPPGLGDLSQPPQTFDRGIQK